ncbi:MAG: ABC transporter ATP-binding protein [Oscillospiraceae bacterium]|nr:ABC transporter ATP-binding protein [Oscillospiraceae bacterium]
MLIEIQHASLTYQADDGEVEALRDISLEMEEGELCSIVGPSGCGKSTLLGAIAGLERLDGGSITLDGEPVTGPSPRIGLMPQRDQLFEWRTILDNVMLGLQVRRQDTPENRTRILTLLERYGLKDFAHKRPAQLSGGMRQRCALIHTLAFDPRILLLDEPFSALDYQTRLAVSADIHAILRREQLTALLVTHDIAEAVSMSDRIFILSRRPAVVKKVHDLTELSGLTPLQRRDHPSFHTHFNAVWKEVDLHV